MQCPLHISYSMSLGEERGGRSPVNQFELHPATADVNLQGQEGQGFRLKGLERLRLTSRP